MVKNTVKAKLKPSTVNTKQQLKVIFLIMNLKETMKLFALINQIKFQKKRCNQIFIKIVFTQVTIKLVNIFLNFTFMKENFNKKRSPVLDNCHFVADIIMKETF
jgi:hypothetical protein